MVEVPSPESKHYTDSEFDEVWLNWGNTLAQQDPEFAADLMLGLIQNQKKLGLISEPKPE